MRLDDFSSEQVENSVVRACRLNLPEDLNLNFETLCTVHKHVPFDVTSHDLDLDTFSRRTVVFT